MISINDAIKKINNGNLDAVYLLFGTEYYFVEQFNKAWKFNFPEDEQEWIYYDLREVSIQQVINDAETLPFFSEKKTIIIDQPVFLKTKQERISVDHDVTVLEHYLVNPAPFTTLIIYAPYEQIDGRKKITKLLRKHSVEIDCQPMKGQNLRNWIRNMQKEHSLHLSEEITSILEAEFGSNLYLLQKEIEKTALFAEREEHVTDEAIKMLLSPSIDRNVHELVDAVLAKDLAKAIKIYKQLMMMNEEPIGMIALLAYQFRMIFQTKILRDKGMTEQHIQQQLNVHPYVIKKAYERSGKFSSEKLVSIINELTTADANIKLGKMDKRVAVELLIYRMVS